MGDESATDPVGKGMAGLRAAQDAMRQVGGQARDARSDAATQAKELTQDARARAASLASAVGDRVTQAVASEKDNLAGQLQDMAQAAHRSGEQLEGHQDWLAHAIEWGADELGTIAGSMRSNDLQGLFGNLQGLAHRQPALFTGASLAAGFALARVGRVAVSGASKSDLPHGARPQTAGRP